MPSHKVALLTAGGLAPCLSSAVGGLIERYTASSRPKSRSSATSAATRACFWANRHRSRPEVRAKAAILHQARRQPDRQQPRQAHQRRRLREARPGQGRARTRSRWPPSSSPRTASPSCTRSAATTPTPPPPIWPRTSRKNDYDLTVVGLPKTIDNDVIPIRQSLGAWTAAEQGAHLLRERRQRAHLRARGC